MLISIKYLLFDMRSSPFSHSTQLKKLYRLSLNNITICCIPCTEYLQYNDSASVDELTHNGL